MQVSVFNNGMRIRFSNLFGVKCSCVFIPFLYFYLDGNEVEKYFPSQLGAAVLASALSPDEGLTVFAELQKARRNFVLENELHIIYQV